MHTQLQHPPPSPAPQQPLASPAAAAVTQNEWSRLRNVDTKGGMSFCRSLTPPALPKPTDMCTSPGIFKCRGYKNLVNATFGIKKTVVHLILTENEQIVQLLIVNWIIFLLFFEGSGVLRGWHFEFFTCLIFSVLNKLRLFFSFLFSCRRCEMDKGQRQRTAWQHQ